MFSCACWLAADYNSKRTGWPVNTIPPNSFPSSSSMAYKAYELDIDG